MNKFREETDKLIYIVALIIIITAGYIALNINFMQFDYVLPVVGLVVLGIYCYSTFYQIPRIRKLYSRIIGEKKYKPNIQSYIPFLNESFVFKSRQTYRIYLSLAGAILILIIMFVVPLTAIGLEYTVAEKAKVFIIFAIAILIIAVSLLKGLAYISLQKDTADYLKQLQANTWIDTSMVLSRVLHLFPIIRFTALTNLTVQMQRCIIFKERQDSIKLKEKKN